MPDLRARLLAEIERRTDLAGAAQEGSGSTSPWVVEYLGTTQRVTNAAAVIIAETHVGSPLPGHRAMWAPEPEHIALHDPADALRRYTHYRRVLERHWPSVAQDWPERYGPPPVSCGNCTDDYPCDDVKWLADALGIDLEVSHDGQ